MVIQNGSWHGQKNADVSVPAEVIADRNLFFVCVPVFISLPVGCPQPLQAHNSHATFDQVQQKKRAFSTEIINFPQTL